MAFNDYRDLIRQMEREMQQFSDEAFRGFFSLPNSGSGRFWQPPVDIHETEAAVVVKVELAGVKAADLQVSLTPDDRILHISGTRAESHGDRDGRVRCHQLEIYFGPFERAVALPTGIRLDRDAIKATYRDGFLSVRLPKKLQTDTPEIRIIAISTEPISDEFTEDTREDKDTQ